MARPFHSRGGGARGLIITRCFFFLDQLLKIEVSDFQLGSSGCGNLFVSVVGGCIRGHEAAPFSHAMPVVVPGGTDR